MKAIQYTAYGPPDVLQLREIEKPSPKENEVLVKVHASSVNAIEWRRFMMPWPVVCIMGSGLRVPKDMSIGGDLAGSVEAVGANVKQFRPGDDVFGLRRGAYAEYVCAAEDKLVLKPANVSFEAAAAVPIAALTALQGVRDQGKIQAGHNVLIYGAGGGVGTFAVQIAKSFGAEVSAVCGPQNLEVVRSIGADHVMDYTQEDFAKRGARYDVIVGVNGYQSIFKYRRALKPNGVYVFVGGFVGQILQTMLLGSVLSWFGKKKIRGVFTKVNQKDLLFLKELMEAGKVVPVIDRSYPLSETAEAMKYLMEGHPRGKVVITIR